MSGQVQKSGSTSKSDTAPSTTKPKDLTAKGEELKDKADEAIAKIDDLLDEVEKAMEDTLGELSAEAFCQSYIQRGGE